MARKIDPDNGQRLPSEGSRAYRASAVAAVAAIAVVLAGAAFPASALVDAVSGAAPGDARLVLPGSYVALAPFSGVLDTLSLFTVAQHAAFLATIAVVYAALRLIRGRTRRTTAAREIGRAAALFAVVVALYAVLALVPRPMAGIALARADELAVDVHAHTDASHDGRRGFTAEHVRAWHRQAGFAAVYVTDHRSFDGAAAGIRANPARAGLGTSVFSGIEVVSARRHVNVLGASSADSAHFRRGTLDPDSLAAFRPGDGSPAVLVLTIPGSVAGMSPRGLRSGELQRTQILRLARERRLALVAGSDNHGWGRTAAAWTVISVPGWREMAPPELDRAIRRVLLAPDGVRVVERRRPATGDAAALVATVPRAAWLLARTLSWPERAAWIGWIAAIFLLRALAERRRHRIRPDGAADRS